ncbi:MAG: Cell division control protein 11, partial [Paramarteilia canceri]
MVGLTEFDIETLTKMQNVNKIIVVGKSDSLTSLEFEKLKKKLQRQIDRYKIDCNKTITKTTGKIENICSPALIFVASDEKSLEKNIKDDKGRNYDWGFAS